MVLSTALFDATCKAWYPDQIAAPRHAANGPAVDVKNRRDAEAVNSPFVLSLGVLAQGVAPAGATVKDAGYFAITVARGTTVVQKLALTDGRTETIIDLPRGEYELALSLLDGGGKPLLKPAALRLTVAKQGR